MNDNADQHWSFSRMVWDGFAQWPSYAKLRPRVQACFQG